MSKELDECMREIMAMHSEKTGEAVEIDVSDLVVEEDDGNTSEEIFANPKGPRYEIFVTYGGAERMIPQLILHYTNEALKEDYMTCASPDDVKHYLMQADARNEKIPRAVGKAIIHPTFVELTKLYFKTLDDRDPAGEDAARRVREAVFTLMEPLERDGNVVTLPCKREAPVGGKEIPYAVNQ